MMEIAKLIIMGLATYYSGYILRLFFIKKDVQQVNKKLNKLRKVPVKSIEAQKAFLDLKFPKRKKEKYFAITLWKNIKTILFYIPFGVLYYQILNRWVPSIPLWIAITAVFVFPALINLVLKRFGVEKNDITIMFKGNWFSKKNKGEKR